MLPFSDGSLTRDGMMLNLAPRLGGKIGSRQVVPDYSNINPIQASCQSGESGPDDDQMV